MNTTYNFGLDYPEKMDEGKMEHCQWGLESETTIHSTPKLMGKQLLHKLMAE